MSDLLAARSQMAVSLGFHIVFAAIGIGLPVLMAAAEGLWLRRRDPVHLEITKAWARGLAIFFAVGAVSGTVLSFELGLLWPRFMEVAGPLIGMPFSLEGFAFFTEAIFLGGWGQFPWLVTGSLTIEDAVAPPATLRLLLIVIAVGAVVLLPSLAYLLRTFKGGRILGRLEPEGSGRDTGRDGA